MTVARLPQSDLDFCRVPARLYQFYGPALKLWLLARAWDNNAKGCGHATFSLQAAARVLQRSVSTVRRLLAEAKNKGLLRFFQTRGDTCTAYYASLVRVARRHRDEMGSLGPIATCWVGELSNLNIICTEMEAEAAQNSSYYAVTRSKPIAKLLKKTNFHLPSPKEILGSLQTCGSVARVLGASSRFLLVSEGFLPYGASQPYIANRRGVHRSTVQRHLSNTYRAIPSPAWERRANLEPVEKKQLAQAIPRSEAKPILALFRCGDGGLPENFDKSRLFKWKDRLFYARCNLYYPKWTLESCKYRHLEFGRRVIKTDSLTPRFLRWKEWPHSRIC